MVFAWGEWGAKGTPLDGGGRLAPALPARAAPRLVLCPRGEWISGGSRIPENTAGRHRAAPFSSSGAGRGRQPPPTPHPTRGNSSWPAPRRPTRPPPPPPNPEAPGIEHDGQPTSTS